MKTNVNLLFLAALLAYFSFTWQANFLSAIKRDFASDDRQSRFHRFKGLRRRNAYSKLTSTDDEQKQRWEEGNSVFNTCKERVLNSFKDGVGRLKRTGNYSSLNRDERTSESGDDYLSTEKPNGESKMPFLLDEPIQESNSLGIPVEPDNLSPFSPIPESLPSTVEEGVQNDTRNSKSNDKSNLADIAITSDNVPSIPPILKSQHRIFEKDTEMWKRNDESNYKFSSSDIRIEQDKPIHISSTPEELRLMLEDIQKNKGYGVSELNLAENSVHIQFEKNDFNSYMSLYFHIDDTSDLKYLFVVLSVRPYSRINIVFHYNLSQNRKSIENIASNQQLRPSSIGLKNLKLSIKESVNEIIPTMRIDSVEELILSFHKEMDYKHAIEQLIKIFPNLKKLCITVSGILSSFEIENQELESLFIHCSKFENKTKFLEQLKKRKSKSPYINIIESDEGSSNRNKGLRRNFIEMLAGIGQLLLIFLPG